MPVIAFNGTEIPVRERAGPSGVEYTFPLAVPATGEPVTVIARIGTRSDGMRAVVHVKDAPDCRRHRFSDQSLCMWFDPDATGQRWTMADGLDQLAAHVARHLFQEASAAQVTRGPVRSRPARTRDRGPARRAEAKGLDPVMTALICGHSFGDVVRDFGPMLALVGVAGTLFVNGAREERRRRREIHARELDAIARYYEMPFLIRRRRHDEPSAERVRLTERFADVQAELASCEALMRADPDPAVRKAYAALVTAIRTHAGAQASSAWDTEPIRADAEMGMGDVIAALGPIEPVRETCEHAMAKSTAPRHRREQS